MGIAMDLELTKSVGRSGSQIAPPEAPRTTQPTTMNIYLFLLGPISFFWFVGLPSILLALTNRSNFIKIPLRTIT